MREILQFKFNRITGHLCWSTSYMSWSQVELVCDENRHEQKMDQQRRWFFFVAPMHKRFVLSQLEKWFEMKRRTRFIVCFTPIRRVHSTHVNISISHKYMWQRRRCRFPFGNRITSFPLEILKRIIIIHTYTRNPKCATFFQETILMFLAERLKQLIVTLQVTQMLSKMNLWIIPTTICWNINLSQTKPMNRDIRRDRCRVFDTFVT